MKKILAIVIFVFAISLSHAQTVALPAATAGKAVLSWSLPSNCNATQTCQFQVYKIQGSCPASLAGSTGWTLVSTTPAQALGFSDTSVTASTQYSYDVEAIPTGTTGVYSGPSNCQTTTIPFTPAPPVLAAITN